MLTQQIFMLGIGGIGMSGLARHLMLKGHRIFGYDRTETDLTRNLEALGATLVYDLDRLPEWRDDVIYTPAVPSDTPLLAKALAEGRAHKRAKILGEITAGYRTIAVGGTHGKTSISTMLTHLLKSCQIDLTSFMGGVSVNYDTNYLAGASDWLVTEADEYDRSFLNIRPETAIISSTDADHLDIYGAPEALVAAYQEFAEQTRQTVILHEETRLSPPKGLQTVYYGKNADAQYHITGRQDLTTHFDYISPFGRINRLELNIPGEHNVQNMTAALTAALLVGAPPADLQEAVRYYCGVRRRFEVVFRREGLIVVDDYAHHPTEIHATLTTARALFPDYQLIAAFQPHLYTRTRDFMSGFAEALSLADVVYLTHIYAAREHPLPGVECEHILPQIRAVEGKYVVPLYQLPDAISQKLSSPAIILILGAGNINSIIPELISLLKNDK